MIITPLTIKALEIATEAHKGQFDKGGNPYILHPIYVAEGMKDEVTTIVALLHDVLEDTNWKLDDLSFFGCEVLDALCLLNHNKEMPYEQYIKNLAVSPVARKVKIRDLKHNMDLTRLQEVTVKDIKRVKKYMRNLVYLQGIEKMTYSYSKKRKTVI